MTDLPQDSSTNLVLGFQPPDAPNTDRFGLDGSYRGNIAPPSIINGVNTVDIDAVRVNLVAGQGYVFTAYGNGYAGLDLEDPYLVLADPTDTIIAENDNLGQDRGRSQIIFTAPQTATYFLAIFDRTGGFGEYQLTIAGFDTISDVPYRAPSADAFGRLTSAVDYVTDTDMWAMNLIRGVAYNFSAAANGVGGLLPKIEIRNANNDTLVQTADFGSPTTAALTFTPSASGVYYVGVRGARDVEGGSRTTGEFTLQGDSPLRTTISSFDAALYLASNPDVLRALGRSNTAALDHYINSGLGEGRATRSFDPLQYLASNADLARTYGADANAGLDHFLGTGALQNRPTSGFDALLYAASYPDLARAFGADASASRLHYLQSGADEGRATSGFDPLVYGASHSDLARAFGSDARALLTHYLVHGADEGRGTFGFDPLVYGATNPDLARAFGSDAQALLNHYLVNGAGEGRATSGFDPLIYAATHLDLAIAFATDGRAALNHYLNFGQSEGRAADGFDPLVYAASSIDLARAFRTNGAAALNHYLTVGKLEDRSTDSFDPEAYLAANADLEAAGFGPNQALQHWLIFGVDEGRVTSLEPAFFG